MQQIADWLEKLGMSESIQCFAENKIDVSVLPHLTDQDLKCRSGIGGRCSRPFLGVPVLPRQPLNRP
jgi:hypothetical protein